MICFEQLSKDVGEQYYQMNRACKRSEEELRKLCKHKCHGQNWTETHAVRSSNCTDFCPVYDITSEHQLNRQLAQNYLPCSTTVQQHLGETKHCRVNQLTTTRIDDTSILIDLSGPLCGVHGARVLHIKLAFSFRTC